MRITKDQVIRAILTENLTRGAFVRDHTNESHRGYANFDSPDCSVCAVGATLRSAGFDNQKIHDYGEELLALGDCGSIKDGTADAVIKGLIKNKKYLHALSTKFETLAEEYSDEPYKADWDKVRGALLVWVMDTLPESFTIKKRLP